MSISPLNPPLPQAKDTRIQWGNLTGSAKPLAIANLAEQVDQPILVITPTILAAHQLKQALTFFTDNTLPIAYFPDWETLPYDHFSPHEDIISTRLKTLHRLSRLKKGIVIAAVPTLMHQLLPCDYLDAHTFLLSCNDTLSIDTFRAQMHNAGYRHAEQVITHGEFSVRGSIIDLFPMGSDTPFRIELFDDDIDTIRTFDPDTQRSIEKIEHIELLPAREYPLTDNAITHFRQQWRETFATNPMDSAVYAHVSDGETVSGIEYYLPLFFEKTNTFFDYLSKDMLLVCDEGLDQASQQFWEEASERYEQLRYDITRPLCAPPSLFLNREQLFTALKPFTQIQLKPQKIADKAGCVNFNTHTPGAYLINRKAKRPLETLEDFINSHPGRVLFCADSLGRREILGDLLRDIAVNPTPCETWSDFLKNDARFSMAVAPLESGLHLLEPARVIITESQLFGERVAQHRARQKTIDPALLIRNLTELNIGSPVVHIDHGIGRYLGLQMIKTGDIEAEYITLEYAGGDKIYVPVASLHVISRYTGKDSEYVNLQKLGTTQWQKIKDKTAKQVRDVAAELLALYSERQAKPGFAFNTPDKDFVSFRTAFPFDETPDQETAIDATLKDMTQARAMDRLICGDVGFGKTEVAMQAAFLAVQNKKQVVVLVPTTLLATQHLQNFRDRFADWPVVIEGLSRMVSTKDSKTIIEKIKRGTADIVIGTHKLLGDTIAFKDLGLLIVDEEQRFGVRQKEKIKSLRAHVDILTLTATPIPRTLNMALSGARDLSIISTPPARRLAIKTFVHEYNKSVIREAILREAMRGGQVYFLHNDVATIKATAEKLKGMIPEAKIAIAHGQLPEREMERVMSDFYHQKFNVLVCTTIIESGIDIPTANTIIINKANRFGLSQLHQIRGRVGRSHHQAYAYLLIPDKKAITKDALKRLEAITSMEDLGAGFMLATHDLEIRGAGELLGEEQSGQIEAVGFSLYMELLNEAVDALKAGRDPEVETKTHRGPEIDLKLSALIPETLVRDVHTRLTLYKRLSDCATQETLQTLKAEMVDRFGVLPDVTQNLLDIADLRIKAEPLGIVKIDVGTQYGYLHFSEKPKIDPAKIIQLIQTEPNQFQLQGAETFRFKLTSADKTKRVAEVWAVIQKIC